MANYSDFKMEGKVDNINFSTFDILNSTNNENTSDCGELVDFDSDDLK